MSGPAAGAGALDTPGLGRRLACFVYEGLLLFGVVMVAGLIYGVAIGQRDSQVGQRGLQALLFAVIGVYFIWFWTRSGQTLAMKTWRIRLVTLQGAPVPPLRALARYLLCWIWFLPALGTVAAFGLHGVWRTFGAVVVGVLVYAVLARLHPQRQYWHDALCGTRLVVWRRPG
ncbi:MAG: RDD family protein [Burkholderiales bacterium]|nr:RDD family protein [Burkholderiales bacterium]MDE2394313.1 RDD family protein [Burkholderiales bacterium]MDE2455762.1 RDD family protein [Burkholderiales bacterium]